MKRNKGITLIALIITIIVLLILVIVSINLVTNNNIFYHANNAVTLYNEAQNNEYAQLDDVLEKLNKYGNKESDINLINELIALPRVKQNIETAGGFFIAYNANGTDMVGLIKDTNVEVYRLFINDKTEMKMYLMTNVDDTDTSVEGATPTKAGKWYVGTYDSHLLDGEEYNGNAPSILSKFSGEEIKDQEILDKIINSFNN